MPSITYRHRTGNVSEKLGPDEEMIDMDIKRYSMQRLRILNGSTSEVFARMLVAVSVRRHSPF